MINMIVLTDIRNKKTIRAIEQYGLTEQQIQQFDDLKALRRYLHILCLKKYREKHSDYWKKKYAEDPTFQQKVKENASKRYRTLHPPKEKVQSENTEKIKRPVGRPRKYYV
jgi:hypothetical protein